jgi:hypothetical protein
MDMEDWAAAQPNAQPLENMLTELRQLLGQIPEERRILQQIERLLRERMP